MIQVEKVDFSYGTNQILKNVSLKIEPGKIVGLIGENGAGKSTLMKIMCGLRKPNRGRVTTDGERIGILIEDPALYNNMSVKQNIDFFKTLYGASDEEKEEIISLTGVKNYENERVCKLSVGMKKRVGLTVAILASNKTILLDEPTSGLDPSGIRDTLELIKMLANTKNIGFLISSHIFQDLEAVCNTYYRLKNKELTDIYNNEKIYGYCLSSSELSNQQIKEYLNAIGGDYINENGKICIKENTLTEQTMEILQKQKIIIKKRQLAEVYFE